MTTRAEIEQARADLPALLEQCKRRGLAPVWRHFRPWICKGCNKQDGRHAHRYYTGKKAGPSEERKIPFPRGGKTICMLVDAVGASYAEGIARCLPSDNFVYAIGQATSYALDALVYP